jgi:hypothetical protein
VSGVEQQRDTHEDPHHQDSPPQDSEQAGGQSQLRDDLPAGVQANVAKPRDRPKQVERLGSVRLDNARLPS